MDEDTESLLGAEDRLTHVDPIPFNGDSNGRRHHMNLRPYHDVEEEESEADDEINVHFSRRRVDDLHLNDTNDSQHSTIIDLA